MSPRTSASASRPAPISHQRVGLGASGVECDLGRERARDRVEPPASVRVQQVRRECRERCEHEERARCEPDAARARGDAPPRRRSRRSRGARRRTGSGRGGSRCRTRCWRRLRRRAAGRALTERNSGTNAADGRLPARPSRASAASTVGSDDERDEREVEPEAGERTPGPARHLDEVVRAPQVSVTRERVPERRADGERERATHKHDEQRPEANDVPSGRQPEPARQEHAAEQGERRTRRRAWRAAAAHPRPGGARVTAKSCAGTVGRSRQRANASKRERRGDVGGALRHHEARVERGRDQRRRGRRTRRSSPAAAARRARR